jgi:1,4-dihydroxy-6-naphthoate synthase
MKLTLGFSTCPNDTFIFDAAVHNKIDTEGLEFNLYLADVEELNSKAYEGEIDITKLSYHAFAYASKNYLILNSGSALGNNNGPLLISKRKIYPDEINSLKIAIPGKNTTANLLFSIAYPEAKNKKEYIFSDIEAVILDEEVDAGLIIHENRFTYLENGLRKIIDLGEYWQTKTNLPIPLGCIAVNRKIDTETQKKIDRVIKRSLLYAFENPESSLAFMKKYAQEMNAEVMKKHVELYVNDFSIDLGNIGKKAIKTLYEEAFRAKIIPEIESGIFVEK